MKATRQASAIAESLSGATCQMACRILRWLFKVMVLALDFLSSSFPCYSELFKLFCTLCPIRVYLLCCVAIVYAADALISASDLCGNFHSAIFYSPIEHVCLEQKSHTFRTVTTMPIIYERSTLSSLLVTGHRETHCSTAI